MLLSRPRWAFEQSIPDLAAPLDAWVAAVPGSAPAYLLRGDYWRGIGWHRRGAAFARKTSENQFRGMHEAFGRAEADFRTAIAIDPSVTHAYQYLLDIYSATNRDREMMAIWEQAIDAGAGSSLLYAWLFHSLVPWWSGLSGPESIEVVRSIVSEIETGALQGTGDPDLLRAFPDFIEAEILWRAGKRKQAMTKFAAFIEGKQGLMHLDDYAEHLTTMGRQAEALQHFAARLRYEPSDEIVLAEYGKALMDLKLYDQAATVLSQSLAIDPYDPDTLVASGDLAMKRQQYADALKYYERAKVYGAERAKIWSHTAWMKRQFTGDIPGAAADYRRAVELSPDWTPYRARYANVLDQLQDCGAIPQYRTYLALCQQSGVCKETSIRWTNVRWKQLVDRSICSIDGYRLDPQVWIRMRRD